MTLAELLPAVQVLPTADKIRLIRILEEEVEQAEDISPLIAYKAYELPTPYGSVGAAKALFQALQTDDANPE
jgi:hypothetical protein